MILAYGLMAVVGAVLALTPLTPFVFSFIFATLGNDSEDAYEEGAEVGKMVGIILGAVFFGFGIAGLMGGS